MSGDSGNPGVSEGLRDEDQRNTDTGNNVGRRELAVARVWQTPILSSVLAGQTTWPAEIPFVRK